MTNTDDLKTLIKNRGVTYTHLAKLLDLSVTGLMKKINNEIEFKPSEIELLCNELQITSLRLKNELFFYSKVD